MYKLNKFLRISYFFSDNILAVKLC